MTPHLAVKNLDFCVQIPLKGPVFGLMPSPLVSAGGDGLVLPFSGQKVFLQMKGLAF